MAVPSSAEYMHMGDITTRLITVMPRRLNGVNIGATELSSDTFDPQRYTDEVREKMMELIQAKVEGQDILVQPTEAPATQIIDLMAALKASLGEDAGKRKPDPPGSEYWCHRI